MKSAEKLALDIFATANAAEKPADPHSHPMHAYRRINFRFSAGKSHCKATIIKAVSPGNSAKNAAHPSLAREQSQP
jgi:hypothetical protein